MGAPFLGCIYKPGQKTAFEFQTEGGGTVSADILKVDARFVSLLKWLGRAISMCAFPALMKQRGMLYTRSARSPLEAVPSFPQRTDFFPGSVIRGRLQASSAPAEESREEDAEEDGDREEAEPACRVFRGLPDLAQEGALPDNIRLWARRNLAVAQFP